MAAMLAGMGFYGLAAVVFVLSAPVRGQGQPGPESRHRIRGRRGTPAHRRQEIRLTNALTHTAKGDHTANGVPLSRRSGSVPGRR